MPSIKTCGGSFIEVGPYEQTLFLGCSVTSFNMNLGWGADASNITVNLTQDSCHHPASQRSGPLRTLATSKDSLPVNAPSTALNNVNGISDDSSKNLHRPVIKNVLNQFAEDSPGKVYWTLNGKGYWAGPDPGFVGKYYDIIGAPAYFKFMDGIEFGGVIADWKVNNSLQYEVNIKSYASLLGGCQLIIDNYIGSISTIINDNIAVPSLTLGDFSGSVKRGNVPNVFNIYGYLESYGFGTAGKTDGGVSALQIYRALQDLTNGTQGPYSPYGAIVAKHLTTLEGGFVDVSSTNMTVDGLSISLANLGLSPNIPAIDGISRTLLKLDISEVPVPPNDLYISSSYISILDFISRICSGAGFDFYVSFEKDLSGNFSGILKIKTVSRRVQPKKDIIRNIINQAVTQGQKIVSYNYGQEFNDQETRSMYIGGPQKRLLQVLSTHLSNKQSSLVFDPYAKDGGGAFISYDFSDGQHNYMRVPDEGNYRMNQYSTDGGAAVGQNNTIDNFNQPDSLGNSLTIAKGNYYPSEQVVTQDDTTSQNPLLRNTNSYPLYLDLISPFFGTHGDNSGQSESSNSVSYQEPRKVFLDPKMGQLQIAFRTNDITTILSKPYFSNGEFVVLENELRAAGSGFESWFTYCFDNIFSTDIADLLYASFRNNYPKFANKNKFLAGLSIINWNSISKSSAVQANDPRPYAINIENAQPYIKFLYNDLQKVHAFFQKIAQEYYGKQYMVRTPRMQWYRDGDLKVSFGNFAYPGSGKIFTDWEISPDGAWEEPGNVIDDTMVVGSTQADLFCGDDGKIQPILGFNANGELGTRDLWITTNLSNLNNPHLIGSLRLVQTQSSVTANNNLEPFFYFPLEHNLDPDSYLYIKYTSPLKSLGGLGNTDSSMLNLKTAHGTSIPDSWHYKMYVKSTANDKILYLDGQPRAVISTPAPILVGGGKNDTEDSLFFCCLHDAICILNNGSTMPRGASTPGPRLKNSLNNLSTILFSWGLASVLRLAGNKPSLTINNSSQNVGMMKKASCPAFAAIPVQFNRATYGPWINHPGLVGDLIFPGLNNVDNLVNNIVGGVKVDVDTGLVPWEYGGMDALDSAVMNRIKDDINYQQITEQGSLDVAGLVFAGPGNAPYGIGGILSESANATAGPIINNINISIGEGGITTRYGLRTYVKKIGFFNKENADRIKQINLEFLKRRRELNNKVNDSTAYFKSNAFTSSQGNGLAPGETPKPLRWSPLEVLAGGAYPHVHYTSSVDNAFTDLGFSPYWSQKPYVNNVEYRPKDMARYLTNVAVQDIQELPRELQDDFANKSFMSLDGLLSPISFYPTPYGSTYNITKYPRSRCPFCKGRNEYSWERYDLSRNKNGLPRSISELQNLKITIKEKPCPFCEEDVQKDKRKYISASPKETTPPYILASGEDDLTIISRNSLNALSGLSGNPVINYGTLNPILLPSGEFSCYQNRQQNDFTSHSIDLVGFGLTVPENENSLKPAYSADIEKNFLDYDQNYIDYCQANNQQPIGITPSNNMRFFGLRGPLMVHGWGYDLEGYPVPNASGEYKIQNGQPVKDNDGNYIYKNQTINPDGSWTKPYKENSFYKGWGQLPGTWPVGPIDLRWDEKAGVWTVGANYKSVWIVLETDLVKGQPSRGTILEDQIDNSPLPSGIRRLVFVKDTLGVKPAPRAAPVYCKYNGENGFYEPIYSTVYTSSGIIAGDNSVDMYLIYNNKDNKTYNTKFDNPLDFNVNNGDKGLFSYINGVWVLQSYRC